MWCVGSGLVGESKWSRRRGWGWEGAWADGGGGGDARCVWEVGVGLKTTKESWKEGSR